jgi:hypothetical protein
MDTFHTHSTHSLSFNKCAVASDKVVSAHKEIRSAHAEMSKMEVQDKGAARKESAQTQDPQLCHEVNSMWVGLFLYTCQHVPGLVGQLSLFSKAPSSFSFLGGLLSLVSELDFLVYWFCMTHTGFTTRE